jgi:hypothetical protein
MSLLQWFGPTNGLVQAPDSPHLEYSDRTKRVQKYIGLQSVCALSMISRGTFGTGADSGWIVTRCYCDNSKGNIGTLVIEWEAGGSSSTFPLPVGSFSLKPQELYPKIERAGVFLGITYTTLNVCRNAVECGTNSAGNTLIPARYLESQISVTLPDGHPNTVAIGLGYTADTAPVQLALAQKLLDKWVRGEESFYLAGWRYTYEVFSYNQPTLNQGGFTGTPGGPLGAPAPITIYGYGTEPTGVLPPNTSWIRLADELDPSGTPGSMYCLKVTWLGGPQLNGVGYWDSEIYAAS